MCAGDKTCLVLGCEVLANTSSALQGRQIALPSLDSRREPGGERRFPLEQEARAGASVQGGFSGNTDLKSWRHRAAVPVLSHHSGCMHLALFILESPCHRGGASVLRFHDREFLRVPAGDWWKVSGEQIFHQEPWGVWKKESHNPVICHFWHGFFLIFYQQTGPYRTTSLLWKFPLIYLQIVCVCVHRLPLFPGYCETLQTYINSVRRTNKQTKPAAQSYVKVAR